MVKGIISMCTTHSPQAVAERGHRWSQISKLLPGRYVGSRTVLTRSHATQVLHLQHHPTQHRTDNAVKNHWNSSLKKRRNSVGAFTNTSRKSTLHGIRSLTLRSRNSAGSTPSSGGSGRPDDASSSQADGGQAYGAASVDQMGVVSIFHDTTAATSKLSPSFRKSLAARAAATVGSSLLNFEDDAVLEGYMEGMTHEGMPWESIVDQAVEGPEELAAGLHLSDTMPGGLPTVPRRYNSAPLLGTRGSIMVLSTSHLWCTCHVRTPSTHSTCNGCVPPVTPPLCTP